MLTLQFLPWCPLDSPYTVGEIELLPLKIDQSPADLGEATVSRIRAALKPYRDIEGRPVRCVALVKLQGRPVIGEVSDQELQVSSELCELACFSGLSKREFFNPVADCCNKDCFALVAQRSPGGDAVALVSRRREGSAMDLRYTDRLLFSIPVHVSAIRTVTLDRPLLEALATARTTLPAEDWGRWQNAISCFNQANTDNYSLSYQVEWVLLASAFEHLLGAEPNARDVATKFRDALVPSSPLAARDANRRADRWSGSEPLRYEWMREFYRIRGDFAHGVLRTRQPAVWTPEEHLILAAIGFPLLARALLAGRGLYRLTREDRAQINCFERLADATFRNPPPDQSSNLDWVWTRLVHDERFDLVFTEAASEVLGSAQNAPEEPRPESD